MKGSLSEILILTLLITAFIVSFSGFYGALMPAYGGSNSSAANFTSPEYIVNLTAKVGDIQTKFKNASDINNTPPQGSIGYLLYAPYQYIVGAVQAGLLVFTIPDMIGHIESDILVYFLGIPQYIIDVVNAIVMIIVTFAIIYFIVGKR